MIKLHYNHLSLNGAKKNIYSYTKGIKSGRYSLVAAELCSFMLGKAYLKPGDSAEKLIIDEMNPLEGQMFFSIWATASDNDEAQATPFGDSVRHFVFDKIRLVLVYEVVKIRPTLLGFSMQPFTKDPKDLHGAEAEGMKKVIEGYDLDQMRAVHFGQLLMSARSTLVNLLSYDVPDIAMAFDMFESALPSYRHFVAEADQVLEQIGGSFWPQVEPTPGALRA